MNSPGCERSGCLQRWCSDYVRSVFGKFGFESCVFNLCSLFGKVSNMIWLSFQFRVLNFGRPSLDFSLLLVRKCISAILSKLDYTARWRTL